MFLTSIFRFAIITFLTLRGNWENFPNRKSYTTFLVNSVSLRIVGNRLASHSEITESQKFSRSDYILQYVLTPRKHNSNWIKILQITYFIWLKSCSCPINSFLLWYSIKGRVRISNSHRFTKILKRWIHDRMSSTAILTPYFHLD